MAGQALRILVLNGPNLNLLGTRETGIYGRQTLKDVEDRLRSVAAELGVEIDCRQTNWEGQLIEWIHGAKQEGFAGIVMNPGAFGHYSIAVRDAISGAATPTVEVHISNVYAREPFRHISVIAAVCVGHVAGLGPGGYEWGLRGLVEYLRAQQEAGAN